MTLNNVKYQVKAKNLFTGILRKPIDMAMNVVSFLSFAQLSTIRKQKILVGLKFAHNRWTAKDAGTLKVGRKSIINNEVHSITPEQFKWRLYNLKLII